MGSVRDMINGVNENPTRYRSKRERSQMSGKELESTLRRVLLEARNSNRDLFDSLDKDDLELITQILSDYKKSMEEGVERSAVDLLWEIDYKWKPVDIETFLFDEFYLGAIGPSLYDRWLKDLKLVFDPGSKTFEWIFVGSIGCGKTTVAMVSLIYLLYKLSCLRDPHAFYDLGKGSNIIIGVYSRTKDQVERVGYSKLRNLVLDSPYFIEKFPYVPDKTSVIEFYNSEIMVASGSRGFHALGQDVFALAIDEVNFMQTRKVKKAGGVLEEEASQAYDLYHQTLTRVKSRFVQEGGGAPGMVFLMSSRQHKTSFLEEHMRTQRESGSIRKGKTHISDYNLWEVNPKKYANSPRFRVEVGNQLYPSRVLKEDMVPRKGVEIVEVPEEFRDDFESDVDQALRDIAGVATFGMYNFFRNRVKIRDCIDEKRSHPFTRDTLRIGLYDDWQLEDFFKPEEIFQIVGGTYRPRRNTGSPRYVHVDIAYKQDAAGLVIGHMAGRKKIKRVRSDGSHYTEKLPYIDIDLMIRVKVSEDETEFDISRLRTFILSLIDMGMPLRMVTADGFQSVWFIQEFKKRGYKDSKVLSIDRDSSKYATLKQCINEERMVYYEYPPLINELQELEYNLEVDKVDHPPKGSKDVADCLAGVAYGIMADDNPQYYPYKQFATPPDLGRDLKPSEVVVSEKLVSDAQKALDDLRRQLGKFKERK